MANNFTVPSIGSVFQKLRTPISNILGIDSSMDRFHFTGNSLLDSSSSSSVTLSPSLNFHNYPMSFPEFHRSLADTFPGMGIHSGEQVLGFVPRIVPVIGNSPCESRKRKTPDVSESSSGVSSQSPPAPASGNKRKSYSCRSKRMKNSGKVEEEEEEEKPKEVVHLRAIRGQATDSHSLAERVRRGKINERLRCLQDIVPGCFKTMGLAVMLDEIINYVQSLQNQVEFLSMKLTAASSYYDFNLESDAIDKMQRAMAMAGEAKELLIVGIHQSSNFQSRPWQP
ncbi:hypothetical protein SAY87_026182 [Trapa incisa]|uniref:BHLH domain-containing protein n=1 Tax=Trapa incisa TaxID=236973 RepID=A0AAN7JKH7_9MYRT|nr:hypothetical protein SAY87_026182 [Trapa incisa]